MKRRVKIFFIILLVIYVSYLFSFFELNRYQVISKYSNTRGAEFLKKEALYRKNLNDATNTKKVPYSICFIFLNKKMKFNNDVLYENNRLYIPVSEFLKYFGDSLKSNDDTLKIESITDIDINNRTYIEDNEIKSLRGDIFKKNNEYYISFFDLCEILKVNTYWDYDKNDIYISKRLINGFNDENIKNDNKKKKGFLRFEDFTAGDVYVTKSALEKVRAVVDYMYENEEDFSIGWIPRYINNTNNIDNDISKNESMQNSNFLFTLDYIVNRSGRIGLHGYTHQYKESNSVSGYEFGDDGYNDKEEVRKRVEEAIRISDKLNIPIDFWETPHYKVTNDQQKIFEEYFKIIYEPQIGVYNKEIITSTNNRVTKYIPTSMSYVDDDGKGMIDRIKNKKKDEELSLFYHLSIEVKSVDVSVDDSGNIKCCYNENSILKKIVMCIDNLGYGFEDIKNI
ncbi:DUF2334 domain-containing protein [Clostridium tertium]|jgi:hypothetical protein|uniref:DUF2334 domain-containing protein n=1 Tax=Clostridium TaxID=1485 RepID=UPI00019B01EE|nr:MULTISPECIES: DUF2334 domain-containing protein [Clostridium]EEH98751.1 hypothetical protein CSBG_02377 [Clostridium sp. 7_2_43FAA]MBU6136267.1 DUF2334 domain-containing protein [Clostridium tertium]MDB1941746.1 DUF2334 domain-containing protein [Clostridium tertium]MDB1954441.1 DUF2334 domain-containing protein [Clostridium tertium]MDB1960340.1 DUF2334 domain-containing protein [Clostridium tertium]